MAATLAFVAYRGRPLDVRDLQILVQDELARLVAAGGTLAVRHVTGVPISSLFPGRPVDPGEVHFLELSLAGNPASPAGPTPGDAGLPEGEGLGPALWSDVVALAVSRAAGAALTVLLDDAQQVGYYALFVRAERLRSTWLAAGRRRVEIVETKVEAARPHPENQGGEPISSVPITGLELLLGEGLKANTKPQGFTEQVYFAAFDSGRGKRWIVARDGRLLDEPEAMPEEQAKSLRPVF
jgi:hypothetical protein